MFWGSRSPFLENSGSVSARTTQSWAYPGLAWLVPSAWPPGTPSFWGPLLLGTPTFGDPGAISSSHLPMEEQGDGEQAEHLQRLHHEGVETPRGSCIPPILIWGAPHSCCPRAPLHGALLSQGAERGLLGTPWEGGGASQPPLQAPAPGVSAISPLRLRHLAQGALINNPATDCTACV